jgi:hypothetical protein
VWQIVESLASARVRARVDEEKERKKVQRDRKAGKQTREIETEKKGKRHKRKRKTGRGQVDRRGGKRIHACMHSFIHSFIHAHTFFELWQGHQFLEGCHQRNQAAAVATAAEATAERRQKTAFVCVCLDASDIFETYQSIHTDKCL